MSQKNKTTHALLKKVNDINPSDYVTKPMQIINKKHADISFFKRSEQTCYIYFENEREIHFSSAATKEFNLRIGMFVHFINEEDFWYFTVNKDEDGFFLQESNRRHAVAIYNSSLIKMFTNATRCSIGTKFLITKTKMEYFGKDVYKIDIHHPLEQIKRGQLKL